MAGLRYQDIPGEVIERIKLLILDSLGWGYYRLGQYPKSIEYLQRALAKRPDPEVAAHLGEVLWKTGQQDAANKIWRDALNDSPSNPMVTETMKRIAK